MSDQSTFVEHIATTLRAHRLDQLVLMALEVGRPFTFIGGQLLWMAQPALGLLVARETIGQVATLLEEPAAVDQLRQRLEATNL